MRASVPLVLVLLALAASGCGADDDTVRATATRFVEAVAAGDGATACAQLTPDTRAALEKESGHRCREAAADLSDALEPGSVTSVEVYVGNAIAELSSGEAAFLEEGAEGWRVSAAGCTPRNQEPYDCRLED